MGGPPLSSVGDAARSPFLVAHRAGNRLADLRDAERLRATLVEADVRLHRGRLEVRHLKTAGPLPVLWDRWELRSARKPRLQLSELLGATSAETELVLDLKGPRVRLAERVLDALGPYLGKRRVTVCARWWRLLEPFAGMPVRGVHSIGSARQLRRLTRPANQRLGGVSIHERLVDRESIESLRQIADVILAWPVNRPDRARALLALGVDGLITDDVDTLVRSGVLRAAS